jgi:16S rRNA (cytosine967-C5)-methyltransferase
VSETPRSSAAANQLRTFQRLWDALRPYAATDRQLPARIQSLVTSDRRFGSRDRKLYRELLYTGVRFLPWYEELESRSEEEAVDALVWLASPIPAVAPLQEAPNHRFGPPRAEVKEKARILGVGRALLPDWVETQCPAAAESPNLDFLHRRSPLWLRFQTDAPEEVWREFSERGWHGKPAEILTGAVAMDGEPDVTQSEAFRTGKIEIQDLGSQLVLESVGIPTGQNWLDACAGAGGKTLQLARLVGPRGTVTAHDIRPAALEEMLVRARRARLENIQIAPLPSGVFDGVLVDAPCTGSGTWRRSPHLKWCTSRGDISAAAERQTNLLDQFSQHVKSGGLLVYATCSLATEENAGVVQKFLQAHQDFSVVPPKHEYSGVRSPEGLTFWPAAHDSDGFFVSSLYRH